MNGLYTLKTALKKSENGDIESWIHDFLNNEGNNMAFSEGLKIEKRYFVGLIRMPLRLFERCCGPEENIRYRIDKNGFEERVNGIRKRFEMGWDMPPLIINYCDKKFELNDGNHRYEALLRCGINEYGVIVWITEPKEYDEFVDIYKEFISLNYY